MTWYDTGHVEFSFQLKCLWYLHSFILVWAPYSSVLNDKLITVNITMKRLSGISYIADSKRQFSF